MKNKNKKCFNKFKSNTMLLVVCVICFTSSSIGISYSLFFQVKTTTSEQVITTGEFDVEITDNTTSNNYLEFLPDDDYESLTNAAAYTISITNNSVIESGFYLMLTDLDDLTELDDVDFDNYIPFIKAAVFIYDGFDYELISDVISFSEVSTTGDYIFFYDTLGSTSASDSTSTEAITTDSDSTTSDVNYQVKFWLSEFAPDELVGEKLKISISVLADVVQSKMNYTLNGYLVDSSNKVMADAYISFLNGSYSATTSSDGEFILSGLRSGSYPVSVTTESGDVYTSILVLTEGSSESLTSESYYELTGGLSTTFENKLKLTLETDGSLGMGLEANE